MSTIKVTNIQNPSSGTDDIQIDASGNVNIDSNTLYVDAVNNRVGVGTASPGGKLVISDGSTTFQFDPVGGTGNILRSLTSGGSRDSLLFDASQYVYSNGATEYARIDSSGRLLVGTSSTVDSSTDATIQNITSGGAQYFGGTSATSVGSGGNISYLRFNSFAGSTWGEAARISILADAAHTSTSKAGRLVFSTTASGASSPTEAMRITNSGAILVNKTTTNETVAGTHLYGGGSTAGAVDITRAAGRIFRINRQNDDGALGEFCQANTVEGSISVSGTTVSYNGAHLSRWSQLSGVDSYDKTVRPEILRGTVMSNLDEMCDWTCPTSGDCQDNEQLNKTKISDIEGDKNVAGVFQSWDDDDDTWVNDFYLAMTGDFVIRIAAGVTVERGDLLMSAGDGTAKPQDDDIIRSKTVAKVTSTNVSCTYDDGSYCVPCVLMAC